jgi:phage baseplate assembly protein W
MTQEFLGVGWKFPIELNNAGEISFSRYEEDIRESIWIILSTAPGERLMRPDFGAAFINSSSLLTTPALPGWCSFMLKKP